MTTRLWPDWLDTVWAKSPEKGAGGQAESLAQHTWNVLERLADTIRLRPDLPTALGFPRLWHCLFWACWLHDFGKAAQGFQNRLRGGERWTHRHEVLSLAFLDWIASALSEDESRWVAAAIASHHHDAKQLRKMYSALWISEENPLTPRIAEIPDTTLAGLWRWLNECPASWIEALELNGVGIQVPELPDQTEAVRVIREEGAELARRWIKAYARFVDKLGDSRDRALVVGTLALRGYIIGSDHMASAHIGELPSSQLGRPADLLVRLKLDESALYAHQQKCSATQGSAILVAPTGSGKTEAALLWACAQANRGQVVPRLFYTLPYQASMNAIYDRLNERAFPKQVGLEHSRSMLALYRRWLNEDYTPQQAARAARWGRSLARLNYFPVRVLSPYQILKAPYRLKGYETLLSDLFNAAFILDEVHAYEVKRLAMILGTVKYLREQFGACFLVMSATLPGLLEARLADALGEYTPIRATPELFARFRRHRLEILYGDLLSERWLAEIAAKAESGQLVLMCCNTVKRAQQVYDEMQHRLCGRAEIVLLHGRFNGRDRLRKEKIVREAAGSESAQRKPIVLVATQVVEVSLDIDLDVIYTDPAPLEALIQRFGRINRRQRLGGGAPVYVFTEPADGQGIYQDNLVQAALRVLAKNAGQMVDEERISDWLDEVYQGSIAEQWNAAYQQAYDEFEAACLRSLRAFNSDEGLETEFYRAFDSIEVLPVSKEPEYRQFMDNDEPLEASQLLVPLRWGQFYALRNKGKVHEGQPEWLKIVEAEYSSEFGLRLD